MRHTKKSTIIVVVVVVAKEAHTNRYMDTLRHTVARETCEIFESVSVFTWCENRKMIHHANVPLQLHLHKLQSNITHRRVCGSHTTRLQLRDAPQPQQQLRQRHRRLCLWPLTCMNGLSCGANGNQMDSINRCSARPNQSQSRGQESRARACTATSLLSLICARDLFGQLGQSGSLLLVTNTSVVGLMRLATRDSQIE